MNIMEHYGYIQCKCCNAEFPVEDTEDGICKWCENCEREPAGSLRQA